MNEINRKIQALEKAKQEKEQREILQKQAIEMQRQEKQKGFLSGIKSFDVQDI